MPLRSFFLTTFAMTIAFAAPIVWADSMSSASSVASTTAGSASHSLEVSSNSLTSGLGVAQGPYTVHQVTVVAGQPDLLDLHLLAHTATNPTASPVRLRLPRTTTEREQLVVGQTVLAVHRPYGLVFAKPTPHGMPQPFFLVLDDARHRELTNHPVGG